MFWSLIEIRNYANKTSLLNGTYAMQGYEILDIYRILTGTVKFICVCTHIHT